jgi:cob(I)alamin adenosyltransferase
MKIYTKTGDQGMTSLYDGIRISKSDLRMECIGTLDELNSWIGLLLSSNNQANQKEELERIQNELFQIGAQLAVKKTENSKEKIVKNNNEVVWLEDCIDRIEKELPKMTHFILPGGNTESSQAHIARCVCRKTERYVVLLHSYEPINETILKYLNRLSDYLFVLSRKIILDSGIKEKKWYSEK